MKKYRTRIVMIFLMAISIFMADMHIIYAENGTDNVNYYKGKLYKSEASVQELEEILKADGFTCITGNADLQKMIDENMANGNLPSDYALDIDTWFPYYYYLWQPAETCHIYMKLDVMEMYLANRTEENGTELGNNTYVCDYSWFTKPVEGKQEVTEVGSLGISCKLDKDLSAMIDTMSELSAPSATVVLTNHTTGEDVVYNLTKINDYQDIRNVPIGVYTVKSAYIMGGYTGVWSEAYDNGYSLQPNGSGVFFINFENNANIKGSVTNLGYEELQFRKMGVITPDIMTIDRSKERNKSRVGIIGAGIAVIVVIVGLIYIAKSRNDSDYE